MSRPLTVRERARLWLLDHEFVYRSDIDAAEDAHRLALLVTVPGAREAREKLRVDTIRSLNRARDPQARPVRGATPLKDALFIAAIMFVIIAVALTLVTSWGRLFDREDALVVWFGALAAVGVGLLAWLDPLRTRGEIFYSGTSSTVHLVLAVLLVAVFGYAVFTGLDQIDSFTLPSVLIAAVLYLGSAVVLVVLWWRGRAQPDAAMLPPAGSTDRPQGLLQRLDVGRGLLDRADEPALYAVLDQWWVTTAAEAERDAPGRVAAVRQMLVQQRADDPGVPPKDQARLRRMLSSGSGGGSGRPTWEEHRYGWSAR